MARVTKTELPENSLLQGYLQQGDFLDCYCCTSDLDVNEVAARALKFPSWVEKLMALRNLVVAPLGLKTELSLENAETDMLGPFPVVTRTENEIILGLDDKHLDFRLSFMTDGTHAYGATWVRRNNWLGRIYLAVIMPFHILIVRQAIGRANTLALSNQTP